MSTWVPKIHTPVGVHVSTIATGMLTKAAGMSLLLDISLVGSDRTHAQLASGDGVRCVTRRTLMIRDISLYQPIHLLIGRLGVGAPPPPPPRHQISH